MKNIRLLLITLFTLLMLPAAVFGQDTRTEVATIGTDNLTTDYGPSYAGTVGLLTDYNFETLYLGNEINLTADGELTAIEFYVSGGLDLGLLNDVEVYLKTTSQTSLSDGSIADPGAEGYTQISGSFSTLSLGLSGGDIVRFELDSGFAVDQGDNIAIHTRQSITLSASLGADFYATSASDLTRAGTALSGTVPTMEVTDSDDNNLPRPNARLEFETEFTASASNSVITAQQPQILVDGATTLVTLQVRTNTGENVNHGGDTVNFSTSLGSIGGAIDNGDGSYTATLTSGSSTGTATITATLNGSSVSDNAQVDFVDSLAEMFCTDLAPEEIQIGTPTADVTPRGPLYNTPVSLTLGTYQFETIFLQSELGVDNPGFLNAVEFLVDGAVDVDALSDAQFYVKETSATSLSDGDVSLDGYTFVGGADALLSVSISGQDRLRLEFSTPFFYSGDGNIAIHSRHFVLADVDVGGQFHFDSANSNLTKASVPLIDVLGIVAGLNDPETTPERPIAVFDFDFMTTASLSESELTANPNLLPADGTSASTVMATILKEDGSVCVLQAGAPEFLTTLGDYGSSTDEGGGVYTAPLTSTIPGIADVTVEIDGAQLDDTEQVEFTGLPPSPDFTTIEADPAQILADGSSTSEITVTLFDENNDPVTTGGFDVTLATDAGTLGSVTDNGDGTYNATLTSSTTVETATITGTLEGDAIQDDAQVDFVLLPPSPEFTTIEANPTQILADGSSTSEITVTLRDQNDDPVTTGGYNVTLATDAGTLSSVTDNGDGTYNATLTSSTTVETATITGTLEGEAIQDDAQVDFVDEVLPPSPEFTTIEANPTEILADGSSTSEITVTLRDENNDPVTTGGFAVTLDTDAGTLSSVTDNGDGTYNATLTSSTTVETATITGTLEGEAIQDDAQVDFVDEVLPPSPEFTTIEANPEEILADGSSTSEITVTLRDENDDPVTTGGFAVTLDTDAGTLSGVTDNGDGTYNATLTSSTTVETATITGTLEGEAIQDDAQVDFVALPPSPEFTTIEANPEEILADGSSTSEITVTLRDANDNPVTTGGFAVTLDTDAGTLGSVTDNGDGTYNATLTSSTTEETATITGTLEGEDIQDDAQVDFVDEVSPPSPEFTTIEADPVQILADGSSTSEITVTLRNENDNLVGMGGFAVTLATDAGTLDSTTPTDNGDGTYTAILTSSTTVETATITGTLEGEDIQDNAQVDFVDEVLPPSPENTTIEANPTQILADGSSTSEITVTLYDENNDPVTTGGFDVALETDAGTLGGITDNGDGTYNATLTSSTNEETATITGTLEGEDIQDDAQVDFVTEQPEPDPANTTINADPDEIPADGESTSTITVTLYDSNNDPITTGGYDVVLNESAGTLGNITDNGDGTYTALLTSSTNEETAVITGTLEGEDITDTADVDFVILPPSPETTTIEASPLKILADGESTSTITVTLFDENNNRVHQGGFDVTLDTDAGTLSDVTDNGDGTYTAILTSSTNEEIATITGTLEGEDIEDNAQVEFVTEILPPSAGNTTIDADPTTIFADGESTSTITVTLRDENNELVGTGGFAVTLSTTAGTFAGEETENASLSKQSSASILSNHITDNGDGTYTAILVSSTMEEIATITGTVEGDDIDDDAQVEFILEAPTPSPEFTTIEADPTAIPADGESTSTITVTLFDENGEPITLGGFCELIDLSTTDGTLSGVTDEGDGTCTATLTSSEEPGTATITGTLDGDDIEDDATVEFTADEGPDPGNIIIEADPTEIPADGVSKSNITVILYDSAGEPITEGGFCSNIDLASTGGTLSDVTDNGDGTCAATLTSSEEPGQAVITGEYSGETIGDDAIVTFLSLDMFKCEVQTVYPNPFLDNATFRVESPGAGRITLDLYDILGKQVGTVVDEDVTAGEHEFTINGSHLSSGLYIYRYVCPCNCQVDTGRIIHAGRN